MSIALAIYAGLGFFDLVKTEILPEKYQSWTLVRAYPHLPLYGWGIVLLVLIVFVAVEGAHAELTKKEELIVRLEKDLALEIHQREELTQPIFEVILRHGAYYYVPDLNLTFAFIQTEIINKGADSIALLGEAHYKSPTLDADVVMPLFSKTQKFPTDDPNQFLQIEPDEWLIVRVRKSAIGRGHMESGRVAFQFPGNRVDELGSGNALITFAVQDYLGKKHPATYQCNPVTRGLPFSYYPGEKVADGNTLQHKNKHKK